MKSVKSIEIDIGFVIQKAFVKVLTKYLWTPKGS